MILARGADAIPLLFHVVGYGDGTIDGVPFSDAQMSFNAIAENDDKEPVFFGDGFTVDLLFANLSIHSGGNTLLFAPFDTPMRFFVNNTVGVAGFGHAEGIGTIADGADLFHVSDPAFATWDLRDNFSFFFDDGHGEFLQWGLVPVLLGGHTVAFDTAPTQGFFATEPEPTVVALFGTGLVAAALRRLKAKRRGAKAAE
jgi:hypothetical protein